MKLESTHHNNLLRIAFDLLKECNGDSILDIGCGNGVLEQYFPHHQVIGVDISSSALNKARKNAPWAKYILADMRSLPLEDESVDNIAMIAVLGGVPEGEEANALKEAKRLLKSGGHIVILVSQKCQPYSSLVPDRLFGQKWRHFDAEVLQKQLTEADFKINKIIFVGGIFSLCMSLLNYFWKRSWRFFTKRLTKKVFIPHLPQSFLAKIEGLEFRPFRRRTQRFARFFYILAQKI